MPLEAHLRGTPMTQLSDRSQHLLKVLIEQYIRDGQPVGSKTLAEQGGLGLSSATIRNIMADLENHGYLASPHTSAGRVPTSQGYRLFVNNLLVTKPLDENSLAEYQQTLNQATTSQALIASTSNLLSQMTHMAGLITLPKRESIILRHMELLPLSGNRVLVILVVNESDVQNRVIQTDRKYSASELQQVANFLSERFAGNALDGIREALMGELRQDQEKLGNLMQSAVTLLDGALEQETQEDPYILSGQNHLVNMAEDASVEELRSLFDAFNQKRDILNMLDKCLGAKALQIYIGEESGYDALQTCSLITAPYREGNQFVGVLGVIGPTRMDYEKVIPMVNITAKLLSYALNPPSEDSSMD